MENNTYYSSYLDNKKALLASCEERNYVRNMKSVYKTINFTKNCLRSLQNSTSGNLVWSEADFSQKEITSLEGIPSLPHVRKLDLSRNQIHRIGSELNSMLNIYYLDLSYNKISELDVGVTNLRLVHLNISHNNLNNFPDLALFPHLKSLDLSFNNISEFKNSIPNNSLITLHISENPLLSTSQHLESFFKIATVFINNCNLKNSLFIRAFFKAQYLSLNRSCLKSLKTFDSFKDVISLDLSYNNISTFQELEWICPNPFIAFLDLTGNKVQKNKFYYETVLSLFPGLLKLDGSPISSLNRYESKNLYGLYDSIKTELSVKWLPQEQFIDSRFFSRTMKDRDDQLDDNSLNKYNIFNN